MFMLTSVDPMLSIPCQKDCLILNHGSQQTL